MSYCTCGGLAKTLGLGGEEEVKRASSSKWHVGHRLQVKRYCNILKSKLHEVSSTSSALPAETASRLQECEQLMQQMEVLLNGETTVVRKPTLTPEGNLPPEVSEWLRNHWSDSAAAEVLSPRASGTGPGAPNARPSESMGTAVRARAAPLSQHLNGLLAKIGTPAIDAVVVSEQPEVAGNVITVLFMYTLTHGGVSDRLPVAYLANTGSSEQLQDRLMKFMQAVDKAYLDTPYHNNMHAADVAMMMHWFFQSSYMHWLTPLDHLLGLLAATVHDVGHDGVNNIFHVKTQSQVALRYNDRSVLENMHCSLTFEMLKENQDMDWLSLLTTSYSEDPSAKASDLQQYVRRGIIEMVLATDTTKHDALMGDLKALCEARGEVPQGMQLGAKQKQDAMNVLLHSADVSNPTRLLPISLFWARRVLLEFWAQGDQEKSLGLEVSPLCDRASGMVSVPQGQIGFINFIVHPLYKRLSMLLPEVKSSVEQLEDNVKYWQKKKEEGASFEQCFAVLDAS